ncbi:scarecrow-like protein 33 [Lycium ferocissimum]|uniref:scarecrow-like protein 33 n=1 Tax=Lycium ferocissimum TaxID=112874 RepID=UPI0028152BD3|nr:scarecrow-like protein 33 [Lycium ferocissimum]XP_059317854.1 scarecrow-like protein 33 [Lycium ferocissimum]XP_059317855.1 scarecrow-like protein 33 [Lycium ferocissimum]
MKIDEGFMGFYDYEAGLAIKSEDEACPFFPDPNLMNNLRVSDNLVNSNADISPFQSVVELYTEARSFFPDPNLINNLRVGDNLVNRNVDISSFQSVTEPNTEARSFFPDQNLISNLRVSDSLVDSNVGISQFQSDVEPNAFVPSTADDAFHEDYDFSDVVLKYINQMLMEEDIEEKNCMFQEPAALQAAERLFYDLIGQKYPPQNHEKPSNLGQNGHYTDHSSFSYSEYDGSDDVSHVPHVTDGVALHSTSRSSYSSSGNLGQHGHYTADHSSFYCSRNDGRSDGLLCPNWNLDLGEDDVSHVSDDVALHSTSRSSYSSSGTITDVHVDSPVITERVPDIFSDRESIMQFKKGVEEASKFLPTGNSLLADVRYNVAGKEQYEERKDAVLKYGQKQSPERSRGKKNTLHEDVVDSTEGKNNKQSAVFSESIVRSEMFDSVLLCNAGKNESALRETFQAISRQNALENGPSKGSNGKKLQGKKKRGKRDVVDLRTLLTNCAQAVAAGNQRTANELLKQIRQSSSPLGDGMQRLAHYFADGLEARMAGSGTHIYKALITRPVSASDVLKAYHLLLAACPFRTMSSFFSNKTIMNLAEKASTVHIIDIGIMWGFQWPGLIQRLSSRLGGPLKLRITGIDFPHPGFRPAERVEETGRRLANYAESFNVPFEFNAIAQKWETVKLEDLKINKGEVLVVNCLYRFRNLLDETVVVNSPRDVVLNLIRQLNPDVFIQGIVNGGYNVPFFISRFREAIFHYSSLFDMLDAIIPREVHERMLVEKNILGREAMNVIACEGAERIERPETYKRWQVRIMKAGFRQLPLDEEIMRMTTERFKVFDKNFGIDVDSEWLLQGWKGRIGYALSTWKAAY